MPVLVSLCWGGATLTPAWACLDDCHCRTAALSISQHPLHRSCHMQPPGAAILTCFDEAGWAGGVTGADGTVKLAGVMRLASSRAFLQAWDSRKPPWPNQGCQILIPITPLETGGAGAMLIWQPGLPVAPRSLDSTLPNTQSGVISCLLAVFSICVTKCNNLMSNLTNGFSDETRQLREREKNYAKRAKKWQKNGKNI